jgi:hypothetical protein
MAKLHQEVVVVKISKLLKDGEHQEVILSPDMKEALSMMAEQLIAETAGAQILIEVSDLEDQDR